MDDETSLLPVADTHDTGFDVVLRGYDRGQVDSRVKELEEAVAAAEFRAAALDNEVLRLERQVHELRAEVGRTTPSFDALGARVAQILSLAEEEATALRTAAEQEADRLRTQARADADRLAADARDELAGLERRREDIRTDLWRLRDRLAAVADGAGEAPVRSG